MSIILENLQFGYEKNLLFNNLSLNLNKGQIVGLLGKNGAGKTSLLRILAGLVFPYQGQCLVLEEKPSRRRPRFLERIFTPAEQSYAESSDDSARGTKRARRECESGLVSGCPAALFFVRTSRLLTLRGCAPGASRPPIRTDLSGRSRNVLWTERCPRSWVGRWLGQHDSAWDHSLRPGLTCAICRPTPAARPFHAAVRRSRKMRPLTWRSVTPFADVGIR